MTKISVLRGREEEKHNQISYNAETLLGEGNKIQQREKKNLMNGKSKEQEPVFGEIAYTTAWIRRKVNLCRWRAGKQKDRSGLRWPLEAMKGTDRTLSKKEPKEEVVTKARCLSSMIERKSRCREVLEQPFGKWRLCKQRKKERLPF
mgnify:CR=1 FL=1